MPHSAQNTEIARGVWPLGDTAATLAFGQRLGRTAPSRALVTLAGSLGAGKTTLVRGLLAGLGHTGPVRSPTYTLVEPYGAASGSAPSTLASTLAWAAYHLDLYRLADPDELEFLGFRDLLGDDALVVIEWPERAAGLLPPPDLHIALDLVADQPAECDDPKPLTASVDPQGQSGAGPVVADGEAPRRATVVAASATGRQWLAALSQDPQS